MDWEEHLQIAEDTARKAGHMLKSNMSSSRTITYKGDVDLVTNFDKLSQKIIIDHITRKFPDHDIMAEEDLSEVKGADLKWIIDPIDGTTNFAHGFPIFCVSLALENKGKVVLGLVYDPMREEWFTAIKGKGAFLNKQKIRVSSTCELDKSLLATGFPYDLRESSNNNIDHFVNFATRVQAIRRCGSAALDLCYVACGRFDGFWELKLNPWDVAAGTLILTEAGGCVSDFKNREFSIYSLEILGSNGMIHEQMVKVLDHHA